MRNKIAHYHEQPRKWLGTFFVLNWILLLCLTPALSAEGHFERIGLIVNGGDAPPLARLEFLAADNPSQLGSGDAVAYILGSREQLLKCNSVEIALLADVPSPGAVSPLTINRETGVRQEPYRPRANLRCSMWVRKIGTDLNLPAGASRTLDLLRGRDATAVIVTMALRNTGRKDFRGGFRLVNVLPETLAFSRTLAVEQWSPRLAAGTLPHSRSRAKSNAPLAREPLPRNTAAFQEHVHGQAIIYEAKAVNIAPGVAVTVDYVLNVVQND